MLNGNFQAQINYSMVKGIAQAIDSEAEIINNARQSILPKTNYLLPKLPCRR